MVGITAFGAYVPRLRLQRKAIVDAHVWADPGLAGKAKGERSMCNWDEDAVTMAVEAGRACLNSREAAPGAVYFASTSAPFADRQNAGIVATALGLSEEIASLDVGASQKAATGALLQAFGAVAGGLYDEALVAASDKRRTKAASAGELAYGDGAAAVAVGKRDTLLDFVAAQSATVDFVDHFRAATEEFDYTWEERWIRDEGLARIVPPVVARALDNAGLKSGDVAHFVMPSTIGRAVEGIARQCGIAREAVCGNLDGVLGETGTAHPLVMLLHALETRVQPGDHVLVVSFGQGCDALVLKATDRLSSFKPECGVVAALENRQEESNYQKYLAFNDLITLEKGMRAERDDYKTALTVTYRKRDMLTGLVGGRCTQCGTLQFPRADICVNPQCRAVNSQEPYPFREEKASILTWSADYLTYTADPPSHYGMITFENGGRFMTDFTDVNVGDIEVGMPVRMMFRIKSKDDSRVRAVFLESVSCSRRKLRSKVRV
ncbi:MAG: 3-oxoacyl-[acyl-carrier-protein] synthase III C-terminal domain-containing protein [Pseudomonadales bacterium]